MLLNRPCWWCSGKLQVGWVRATDPDGNEVRVHQVCERATKEYARSSRVIAVPEERAVAFEGGIYIITKEK